MAGILVDIIASQSHLLASGKRCLVGLRIINGPFVLQSIGIQARVA